MCIAIVKKANATISDDYLKNCFENNSDGAGIAYAKDGQLTVVKGIFDVKTFIDEVRKAEKVAQGAMLIHCRIGTSGLKDVNNCHPHVVNNNCVMIHNGILDIDVPKDSKDSDTVIFVRELLKPLPTDFMSDEGIINMITYLIGTGNKFAFLNSKGEYAIANEEAGEWVNDVWYSNTSYKWGRYSNWTWGKGIYGKAGRLSTPYGYDEDDYYENWYNDRYGKSFDYGYEEPLYLTDKEKEKLEDVIDSLTDEQLIKLGEYPVYDFWVGELKPDLQYDEDGEVYLWELDEFLGELYDERYTDLMERILIAKDNGDDTFDDLIELVDREDDIIDGEVVDVDYSADSRYVDDTELTDEEYEYIYGSEKEPMYKSCENF